MSMFPIPETMMPELKQIEAMNREFAAFLPYPGAANLMGHPVGGMAAMSALSLGVASHAFGLWMGAVASSMEATRQFCGLKLPGMDVLGFGATWEDGDCDVDAAKPAPKSPVSRTKSAAKTLMADFERASSELAGAANRVADAVKKDIGPVAPAASKSPRHSPARAAAGDMAGPELMPEDFRRPAAIDRPAAPDDLKLISGVGPKLEQVLNGLGVWTFAQIAAWTAEEIAWVDDYLAFRGRIGRDGWLTQAAALAVQVGSAGRR
jgi:NADH-quinone oxidoreductase subunit E